MCGLKTVAKQSDRTEYIHHVFKLRDHLQQACAKAKITWSLEEGKKKREAM